MDQIRLTHLRQLEAESIHIIREVAAEFSNPVMLYSIGKDSSVMLHLARKAFYPGTLHLHSEFNFTESRVETAWPSLCHSCRSELTRQGISLP